MIIGKATEKPRKNKGGNIMCKTCGCGHDHEHDHEHEEMELETDTGLTCYMVDGEVYVPLDKMMSIMLG